MVLATSNLQINGHQHEFRTRQDAVHLLSLPKDIIGLIYSPQHLDPASLLVGRSVCKRLRAIVALDKNVTGINFCARAALMGFLSLIQWARANGAPWDWTTCLFALQNGHSKVLQWALSNGCPIPERYRRYFRLH